MSTDHGTGNANQAPTYDAGVERALHALREGLGDRYELEGAIGQGGMAVVYAARDRKHRRRVAIKVLREEAVLSLGAERFLREIEIIAQLTHPNILPLHDSGAVAAGADRLLYYVTPLLEGDTLRARLRREGRIEVGAALQIAIEVTDALAHAHAGGVIHRDIKPENILFQAGHAIVADFGIARSSASRTADQLTATGVTVGTLAYMSPEQMSGDKQLDGRSDVYSLACVICEMITGTIPRSAVDVSSLPVAERSAIPRALSVVLCKAMAADPAERFAGAEEFRRALVDARDQSGSKGRRTSLAALAGVGLVAVAATLYFAIKPRLTDNPVIVVAPFVDRGSDPEATRVADLAADWVSREVARLQAMSVIPMSTARPAWISSPAPERTPAGLARATGAGIVVAGTYARAGTDVRFDIEIVDALRNRIIVALDPVVAPLDSSSAAVTRLADRVAGALAARVGPRSVEPASDPPSVAAFESYQRGMDAFVRSEWEQSISHFTAAMAIDSTYAPPVLWGATAYNNMGRFGTADTLLERLRPMTGRLMPLERVNYEWLRGIIRGDFASQLRWAREGYEIDRATWAFPYGQTLMRTNQPRQALEVLSHYHRNTPFARNWVPYWERTADARHRIGEYAVELDIAREWPGAPQAPRLRQLKIQVRAHAALGNLKELQRLLQLSETLPPDGEGRARTTPANVALVAAEELRAHGRPGAVQSVVDRALALDATAPYLRGQLLYASERWAEALIVFESLARANARNVDFLGSLGATYARLGRRVDAARVDSQLASLSDPYLRGANTLWRARLAAVAGDSAAAVRLIGEAMAAGAPVGMQLHADADFATIERYAPIQRLLNPSG